MLAEEELVARVATLAPELERAVAPLAEHELVREVRTGIGLLAGVQLAPEISGDALLRRCIDDGVLLRVITNNTVQISPPFIVEAADLQRIAETIARALDGLGHPS